MRLLRVACACVVLGACSSLPNSGPSTSEIVDRYQNAANPLGLRLVSMSPAVAQALQAEPSPSFTGINQLSAPRPVDRIGPGDILSVSIYEAGPGLFAAPQLPSAAGGTSGGGGGGATVQNLPRLQVDQTGEIEIPYAGMVPVVGRTPTEVQHIIEQRLAQKASQPQAIVTVVSGDTNSVIVSGDVRNPGRKPLTLARERLLDVIALAGGTARPTADVTIRVTRGDATASVPLTAIQDDTTDDIVMQPQDRVQVLYEPRTFLVFGAAGKVAEVPLDVTHVSLAQAVARSGGLDDNRANPASVFLFRREGPQIGHVIGLPDSAQPIPVIYRIDLRDPQNFFLMENVPVRDKDFLYVANAPTVQFYKFLQLIYTLVTPAVTARELSP